MFCSNCGTHIDDGDAFCKNCGASLQAPGGVVQRPSAFSRQDAPPIPKKPGRVSGRAPKNPYRDQIAQLRLQLKELKINLKELNNKITGTRSNYFEFDSFVQRGLGRNIGRAIEGATLFGPNQQKKQLQDQIAQLERELLSLERSQEQWKLQQGQ